MFIMCFYVLLFVIICYYLLLFVIICFYDFLCYHMFLYVFIFFDMFFHFFICFSILVSAVMSYPLMSYHTSMNDLGSLIIARSQYSVCCSGEIISTTTS